MIKILDCNNKKYISKINSLLKKKVNKDIHAKKIVKKIIKDVIERGDKALLRYEKKFNKNSEIIIKNKVEFLIKNYKTSLLPVWFALLTIPLSSIWSIILAALL